MFEPAFSSVQVLEVDTIVALTVSWEVLTGDRKKLVELDESILDLLPGFEESFVWDDEEEEGTSSVETT